MAGKPKTRTSKKGKTPRKTNKNLKRFGIEKPPPSREKAVEAGRKGGIAKGLAHEKRKDMIAVLEHMLQNPMTVAQKNAEGVLEKVTGTGSELLVLALIRKAMKGDVPAVKEVMDRIYGRALEKSEIKQETILVSVDEEDIKKAGLEVSALMKKLRGEDDPA